MIIKEELCIVMYRVFILLNKSCVLYSVFILSFCDFFFHNNLNPISSSPVSLIPLSLPLIPLASVGWTTGMISW